MSGTTRRQFFGLSLLTALAPAGECRAQQRARITKASKQVAGYIEKTPFASQTCVLCHFYIDPDDCLVVEGPVSPTGYCNYYAD